MSLTIVPPNQMRGNNPLRRRNVPCSISQSSWFIELVTSRSQHRKVGIIYWKVSLCNTTPISITSKKLTCNLSKLPQLHGDVTELGAWIEVSAPHVIELCGNVSAIEQVLAFYWRTLFRFQRIFGDEGCVRVCSMNLNDFAVAEKFYT